MGTGSGGSALAAGHANAYANSGLVSAQDAGQQAEAAIMIDPEQQAIAEEAFMQLIQSGKYRGKQRTKKVISCD